VLDAFDILKKLPDGGIVWVETAKDLETARERIKQFATYKPGEYVIFSQETQSVIEMPWVPFTPEAKTTHGRPPQADDVKKEQTKKQSQGKPSATTKTIIADIIADIARTLHHK
jgi:hypothetical protein